MTELSDMLNEAVEAELAEEPEVVETEEVSEEVDNLEDEADEETAEESEDDSEDDADTDDEPPAAEDDPFDWNEIVERYGDRTVPLKVNGEIVERPLKEAFDGAMMREDYSRKTAELKQAATWAEDVQKAFAADPAGTLQAFAQAYGINAGTPQDTQDQADPYEDFDPDVAAVLRKMDDMERRHQQELETIQQKTQSFEHQQMVAEVRKEVESLRSKFEDFDEQAVLETAVKFNVSLTDAAELVEDRRIAALSRQAQATGATAGAAAAKKAEKARQAKKQRAAGTTNKGFSASDVSVDDFNTISELFEIEMNSTS